MGSTRPRSWPELTKCPNLYQAFINQDSDVGLNGDAATTAGATHLVRQHAHEFPPIDLSNPVADDHTPETCGPARFELAKSAADFRKAAAVTRAAVPPRDSAGRLPGQMPTRSRSARCCAAP